MFVPEYTITSKALKNIAVLEYGKSVIDNTVILPSWEKQLETQAKFDFLVSCAQLTGIPYSEENAKKICAGIDRGLSSQLNNFKNAFDLVFVGFQKTVPTSSETGEEDLKNIANALTSSPSVLSLINYRITPLPRKTRPEEILPEIVELFDWINSLDAKENHPVITAAICKARLEQISPFDDGNGIAADLAAHLLLQKSNYSFKKATTITHYFAKGKHEYFKQIDHLVTENRDYTQWLEYFTEGLSMQVTAVQEKIKLLAKDTKIAKAAGRTRLTPRQEKIIEYIGDFGMIQNKDFTLLFPEKSEDSILRDLKVLAELGVIQKVGSTKSSRYELR